MNFKSSLRKKLQPTFKALKWKRYCRMGLNMLDEKLEPYLNFDNGVFIEAGANDGIKQSNTYYLEAVRSWKGILVEPVPHLFDKCVKNRKSSKVFNAALVSDDYICDSVRLKYADLMTMVKEESGNRCYSDQHISNGKKIQNLNKVYDFEAKAVTLNEIIEESRFTKIDFMSFDMEGYEAEALKGLDLSKYSPEYILIEVRNLSEVLSILGEHYEVVETLTESEGYKDILFKHVV